MHNSCLGISPEYLIFRNAPKPIIDLYGISFFCTNFETLTISCVIVLISAGVDKPIIKKVPSYCFYIVQKMITWNSDNFYNAFKVFKVLRGYLPIMTRTT